MKGEITMYDVNEPIVNPDDMGFDGPEGVDEYDESE